jgi:ATP-binding cassette subfamily C protein CydCD
MTFRDALFVLVLAPEAYLPLRALGANYHASADGMRAAEELIELLEEPLPGPVGGTARARDTSIRIASLKVGYPGRAFPALYGADLLVEEGETVALTGPSGCGKSTLLSVVLGLHRPSSGNVVLGGVDLAELDLDDWRAQLAWVPQRPHLFARSVADNVRLGRPDATEVEVALALEAAGLNDVVERLPDGTGTLLGEGGYGLSAGERQRVALARAFVRDAPLLVLDEPTAGLDGETEAEVLVTVRQLLSGRTALIVAHRPALAAIADRVVELRAPVSA